MTCIELGAQRPPNRPSKELAVSTTNLTSAAGRRATLKRISAAALLATAMACVGAAPAAAVVEGVAVPPSSVPWFASLGGCGGTLVAPDRVLTAAHCVKGMTPAQLGSISVGAVARSPVHMAMHPNWRKRNGVNFLDDVAIVALDAPVTGVPLVALGGPDRAEALILGTGRRFAPGTGHTEAAMLDSTLRTAPLRTLDDAACARAFRGYQASGGERFDARMRCSIDADGKAPLYSGCNGDSGGPLWTGTAAAPVQLGIVSWGGDRCGADHLPSVFADVARYRAFIRDPAPTWAPTRTGATVRISGTRRVGRRLGCAVSRYRSEAGAEVALSWAIVGAGSSHFGAPKLVARGRTYKVTKAARGHRIACFADAANDGGYVQIGLASTRVRR